MLPQIVPYNLWRYGARLTKSSPFNFQQSSKISFISLFFWKLIFRMNNVSICLFLEYNNNSSAFREIMLLLFSAMFVKYFKPIHQFGFYFWVIFDQWQVICLYFLWVQAIKRLHSFDGHNLMKGSLWKLLLKLDDELLCALFHIFENERELSNIFACWVSTFESAR